MIFLNYNILLMPFITGWHLIREIFGFVFLLLSLEEKLISSRKQVVISRRSFSLGCGSSHHKGPGAQVEVDIGLDRSHIAPSHCLRQLTLARVGGPPSAAARGGS